MDGKYQTTDAVYDYGVTSSEPQKIRFGLAKGKQKQQCYNHKKSFNHKRNSHEATLSSYVWHPKETLDVTPNLNDQQWGAPHVTQTSQKVSFVLV